MVVSLFSSLLYALMGAREGRPITGYIKGKPGIFLSAMHIVYQLGAGLLVLAVILTFIRLLRERKNRIQPNSEKPRP